MSDTGQTNRTTAPPTDETEDETYRAGADAITEAADASHWISDLLESDRIPLDSPLAASVLVLGTPWNLLQVWLYVQRGGRIQPDVWNALVFATLWVNVAPYLVWYYDQRVLPQFFSQATELIVDQGRVRALAEKYDRLFAERWPLTAPWVVLLIVVFGVSADFLAGEGLFAMWSVNHLLFFVGVTWLGLLSGLGFMGVVTTLLAIREIAGEDLEIDPLHPDNLGGLSSVGYYSIRTTLTFSSGSLLLPMVFLFLNESSAYRTLIYPIVGLFMGAIALSFVYPTVKTNRQANGLRERRLDQLRTEYDRARRKLPGHEDLGSDEGTELALELELQRLRNEFQDLNDVNLYPLQVSIMLRLASSVLLPLVFLLLEMYFGRIAAMLA